MRDMESWSLETLLLDYSYLYSWQAWTNDIVYSPTSSRLVYLLEQPLQCYFNEPCHQETVESHKLPTPPNPEYKLCQTSPHPP